MVTTKRVRLDWLKPHPCQARLFSNWNEVEIQELADDMNLRGMQNPVHCCKDGTLVRGHRRTAAARILEWKTIDAIIHAEYKDPYDDAVLEDLIKDNLVRRQLTELDCARCYYELSKSCKGVTSDMDRRDYIAKRLGLGKSGRTLERLVKLLELPSDIQHLVNNGTITKSQGSEILRHSTDARESIYREIRSGDCITDVLGRRSQRVKTNSVEVMARQFFKSLDQLLPAFEKQIVTLQSLQCRDFDLNRTLDKSISFLTKLRNRRMKLRNKSIDKIKNMFRTK